MWADDLTVQKNHNISGVAFRFQYCTATKWPVILACVVLPGRDKADGQIRPINSTFHVRYLSHAVATSQRL